MSESLKVDVMKEMKKAADICDYYDPVEKHCTCESREQKLEEELRIAQSDIQSLKNMIVKMCYEKYGE